MSRLVRRPARLPEEIAWNPSEGTAVKEHFEGFDAWIHLAGEPLTFSRWSEKKKKKILFSRTVSTWFLSHIAASLYHPPKVFISASAVGYYGDRGEELLTEESLAGRGFLAHVCCEWEKAALSIESRGARVVHPRFGVVLGAGGGPLERMRAIYGLGLGAVLGSGLQWVSWIAREDLLRGIDHLLHTEIEGAVNFVSPCSVRQREFASTFASFLHRPCWLRIPAWALQWGLGLAAEMVLSSVRAMPQKLLDSGFQFTYRDLSSALQHSLNLSLDKI